MLVWNEIPIGLSKNLTCFSHLIFSPIWIMCKDKHPTRYVPQNKISLKLTLAHDIYTYAHAYECTCTCIPHSTAIIPRCICIPAVSNLYLRYS